MDYLLFEKGKVLDFPSTAQGRYPFFLPLDNYWGSYRLRTEKGTQIGMPIGNADLKEAFRLVTTSNKTPHLGIGIRLDKTETADGTDEKKPEVKFFAVSPDLHLLPEQLKYDMIYILHHDTCRKVADSGNQMSRYQYGRYPDGRMVIYLFTAHETHNPTRIPSE